MNNEQPIFDLIEQYHLGLLTKEEREKVEARMKTDTAFSDYVTFNGFANEIVHASGLELLRAQMSGDLTKIERERTSRNWKIGAGITLAIVGLLALLFVVSKKEKKTPVTPSDSPQNNTNLQQVPYKETTQTSYRTSTTSKTKVVTTPDESIPEKELGKLTDKNSEFLPTQNNIVTAPPTETVVEPKKETTRQETSSKPCTFAFEANVQATCKGEQNGSIRIEQQSISNGTAPYSYHLSNATQQSSAGVFANLAKGNYTLTLTDSKSCSSSKEFTIYEKNCVVKKSFSFNPDYGEKWEMQMSSGQSGIFTIYNRAGITIKSNSFLSDSSIEWDGTNASGALVDAGLYLCSITYEGGKAELIEVTIIR